MSYSQALREAEQNQLECDLEFKIIDEMKTHQVKRTRWRVLSWNVRFQIVEAKFVFLKAVFHDVLIVPTCKARSSLARDGIQSTSFEFD